MATPGPDGGPDEAGQIEFVLFDLGGVLIRVGGVGPMRKLSGIGSDEELWARWLTCPWVRRLEAGQCGAAEFAAGVVAEWELPVSPEEFLSVFAGWLGGPYPGAVELVAQVKAAGDGVRVGCLSNTNAVQWEAHFEGTPLVNAFEFRFLSFQLGMVKPDREIFDAVADGLPTPRHRVLFLDDNAVNVHAAVEAGFVARRAQGPEAARAALVEVGVLAR
jgi:FMN phosphatase YigB (HAD superfamily)